MNIYHVPRGEWTRISRVNRGLEREREGTVAAFAGVLRAGTGGRVDREPAKTRGLIATSTI
jgi:hypothetical protein